MLVEPIELSDYGATGGNLLFAKGRLLISADCLMAVWPARVTPSEQSWFLHGVPSLGSG